MRDRILSVAQLNAYIKGVFEDELVLHKIHVTGEIFEYKETDSATFITLREKDVLLPCVCFEKTIPLTVGDMVSLFGDVTFYERTGKVSFVFQSAAKIGKGNILTEFCILREKLRAEGLFDSKQSVPILVKKIAVITSETGAVLHDFMQTLHRKRKFTDIVLYPSVVQGKYAAMGIIDNLQRAYTEKYDAIVLMRGGGSNDDLSVFNDEQVVRTVAAAPMTVISAIGHETDFTLCDFASTVRTGTPSMAGEYISRRNEAFLERFSKAVQSLSLAVSDVFESKMSRLYHTAETLSYKSEIKIEQIYTKLQCTAHILTQSMRTGYDAVNTKLYSVFARITDSMQEKATEYDARLKISSAKLNSNNPLRILSMGYAKLYAKNGQNVSCGVLNIGDAFNAVCCDGTLSALVIEKNEGEYHGT